MGEDTNLSVEAAAQAFGEAVRRWREEVPGAPDLYLECVARMDERVQIPLPGRTGLKPGRVERRVVVRVGSQQGEVLMEVTASTLTHGVQTVIGMIAECAALGVAGSTARHEWERAYYARLRRPPHASERPADGVG